MPDGTLTFIIPVRHPDTTLHWAGVKRFLTATLKSVSAQKSSNWHCVVAASRGSDLPDMPEKCDVAWVDMPVTEMPDQRKDYDGYNDRVRYDKGLRILAGIRRALPQGHVMVVDSDDWISPKLAEIVLQNPNASGWYFDQGWLYSGGNVAYLHPYEFHMFCGTSHIVRADYLLEGSGTRDYDLETIKFRLGSHRYIKEFLDREGHPLQPLPFIGTAYRIGHPGATSESSALITHLFPLKESIKRPRETLRRVSRLRPVSQIGFPVE